MKILNLVQGSPEWLAHRRTARNASDAPAMMGASPYVTRSELIRQRATGVERVIDAATQAIFDRGHAVEPALRALAEKIIGEDLYPITATSDDEFLGASFDGVNLDETIIFEAKQSNAAKESAVMDGSIPGADYWQIVQQFAICATAEKCYYFVGDGDNGADMLIRRSDIAHDIPKLLVGWKQFDADVATYQPEPAAAPTPIGRAPDALPALRIEVTGMVTASNLAEFRQQAMTVLGSINRDLRTDDDFASAEKTVKWCSDVETRIAAAKQHALSQTASIDELFRTLDDVSAETRRIRLELDKVVKAEKDARKVEIVRAGVESLHAHHAAINATLGEHSIPFLALTAEIGASIKGLRTLSSITDAVDTAVANAKIAASQKADVVRACIAVLAEYAEHQSLIADRVQLCATKMPEDLRNLITSRIAEHQARETARLEAERARIRVEEEAKAKREAEAIVEADRAKIRAEEAAKAQAATENHTQRESVEVERLPHTVDEAQCGSTGALRAAGEPGIGIAKPPTSSARIKLGDINARIAPLSITVDGLAQLGFHAVGSERAAKLYAESDFPAMCAALVSLINRASAQKVAA